NASATAERMAASTKSPITRPTTDSESRGFLLNDSAYRTGGTIQAAMANTAVATARKSGKADMVRPDADNLLGSLEADRVQGRGSENRRRYVLIFARGRCGRAWRPDHRHRAGRLEGDLAGHAAEARQHAGMLARADDDVVDVIDIGELQD